MKLMILWSAPDERARVTVFEQVQDTFDPFDADLFREVELCYLGERSVAAPYFVLCLPDGTPELIVTDNNGETVEPDRVVGELP